MKAGKSIVELAQELQRRKETAKDFLAPVQKLQAVPFNDAKSPDVLLGLVNGEKKLMPMTGWAHSQAATYADIPKAYYDRLRTENPGLLARNINHGFERMAYTEKGEPRAETRMIRTVDGRVQALLSPKYRRLDSYELMDAVMPTLLESRFEVESSEITERRTYIKAVTGRLEGEVKPGDVVQFGLAISNSDVGAGSLRVEPLIFRLVCRNGAISSTAIRKTHVGRSQFLDGDDISELLTDRTRELTDAAFWHQVRDVVRASMRPEIFQRELNRLKEAAGVPIKNFNIEEVVELASKHVGVTQERLKKSMVAYLANGADGAGLTKWGLANAFTWAAQDSEIDYDTATDLERAGSQIITLAPRDWSRIADKDAAKVAA